MAIISNGIYPATYQPYVQQYVPQYQQPQYQVQQSQAVQTPNYAQTSIIWVDPEEVNSYPVAPNHAVPLWDKSGKRIYVKYADATGKPMVETYDLSKHVEAVSEEEAKELPYAMKEDLSAIVTAFKELSGVVSSIKGDVDSLKGDVYGIAGKRRTAKKAEVEEDDA